jgi:CheY-like chemotaxis protein
MKATLTILAAEDSSDDVFLLREAFKKSAPDSRLLFVSDGSEAVAYLKGEDGFANRSEFPFPHVLLLDLNMPRMNGFEVLSWLREDPRCCGLMVHVLTASSREADVQRAYALRANSFIVKPNRFNDLIEFVSVLHRWHQFTSFSIPSAAPQVVMHTDLSR